MKCVFGALYEDVECLINTPTQKPESRVEWIHKIMKRKFNSEREAGNKSCLSQLLSSVRSSRSGLCSVVKEMNGEQKRKQHKKKWKRRAFAESSYGVDVKHFSFTQSILLALPLLLPLRYYRVRIEEMKYYNPAMHNNFRQKEMEE